MPLGYQPYFYSLFALLGRTRKFGGASIATALGGANGGAPPDQFIHVGLALTVREHDRRHMCCTTTGVFMRRHARMHVVVVVVKSIGAQVLNVLAERILFNDAPDAAYAMFRVHARRFMYHAL